jgi:hypothetical protein
LKHSFGIKCNEAKKWQEVTSGDGSFDILCWTRNGFVM